MLEFVEIRSSPGRGKGVFTKYKIEAGTVIEVSPFLTLTVEECDAIKNTLLRQYMFQSIREDKKYFLVFGYVSMYNHSYIPNCSLDTWNSELQMVTVKAIRSIEKDEELFINYNGIKNDTTKIYFNMGKNFAI